MCAVVHDGLVHPMQITKRVIQLAKERALFGFSTLAHRMVQEADTSLVQSLSDSKSELNPTAASSARQFLRQDSKAFLQRVLALFGDYLERAMQTMYTDLRISLENLSASNLSLIDDETVNRQIEVDRLVLRLRDADDENLRRLNLIIAQMHGDEQVRERENPFRPYLMARAVHQVLKEMVSDENTGKMLFGLFSTALVNNLPAYYADIRAVFESRGFTAQLFTRPSRLVRHQRYVGGHAPSDESNSAVLPGLQRVLERLSSSRGSAGTGARTADANSAAPNQAPDFQEFMWNIFNRTKPTGILPEAQFQNTAQLGAAAAGEQQRTENGLAPASSGLISRLNEYQQRAARGESLSADISPDQNQLFAVGEQLGTDDSSPLERVAIDVVAMLFEFILRDEQIPPGLRVVIGQLQIPFLKAAMLAPEVLQQADHSARELLNRMSSAAVGLDPATPIGQSIEAEITRLVRRILADFGDDLTIFSECLNELESFLARNLRNTDNATALSVDALEEAEKISALLINTAISLRALLSPLNLDKRVVDFIMNIWVRVLVQAAWRQRLATKPADASRLPSEEYRAVLPELVWSVFEKPGAQERNALIRLLPSLVKRLKAGLLLIQLSDAAIHEALDQLVEVHTQVLRGTQSEQQQAQPSLEQLRVRFAEFVIGGGDQSAAHAEPNSEPPQVQASTIEAALAERGVSASLDLDHYPDPEFDTDAEWLTPLQLGTCVERWADENFEVARLTWINANRTLYMFKLAQSDKPLLYSNKSLIKSLREGSVRLVEHAPAFERAVESLLIGAEAMQQSATQGGTP
jgi:hypothetical protein